MSRIASVRELAAEVAAWATRWAYKPYPPPDADGRDPWRWCVYCGCDCYEDEPDHLADCAALTGLFPVTPRELGMRGPRDPYAHGMRCMGCGEPFALGDVAARRPTDQPDVFEIVCVGCRILSL